MQIKPKDIKVSKHYWNSVFQNTECEVILRNVVKQQRKANPEEWTPFTWEDYKAFCTHNVSYKEQQVLNAFAKGGKPVWNTSAYLTSGWLNYDEETAQYSLSEKLIKMCYESWPEEETTSEDNE
jgi:hypothetical protein